MDGLTKTNGLRAPISPERKADMNARTRRQVFDAHASIGEQITQQKSLPVTQERAQLLQELNDIASKLEAAYRVAVKLDDETPLDGTEQDAA